MSDAAAAHVIVTPPGTPTDIRRTGGGGDGGGGGGDGGSGAGNGGLGGASVTPPALDENETVGQMLVHGLQVVEQDGMQTVHYLDREMVEHSIKLPSAHGVLESFHRSLEAWWKDLEGAAHSFAVKAGIEPS